MKLFTGWLIMPAVAAIAATGAQAQALAPYEIDQPAIVISDLPGPYAARRPGPVDDGPRLLPMTEVYTVVREGGFSPRGAPRQRGFVYTIAVISPDGDDGRLMIDARDGRILHFMPAVWRQDNRHDLTTTYEPAGALPRVMEVRHGPPRPPASIPRRYANRSLSAVPLPKPAPHAVVAPKLMAAKPKPAALPQQAAAVQEKPADTKPVAAAATPVEAKPSASIEPTQTMPPVQGLN
ncbi:MAG: hypothetical protein ABIO35_00020 [Nitrobacter sp.]